MEMIRHQPPLREVVSDALRERITLGDYEPGDNLVEERLARELGVSRNPVREALHILNAEGFVELIPRRGAVVARLSHRKVAEIFEVRTALEGLAAELAAIKANKERVEQLFEILARAKQGLAMDDEGALVEANALFHEHVIELADNSYLAHVMTQVRGHINWIFRQTASGSRGHHSLEEHVELAHAIASGKPRQASELARRHVEAASLSYWRAVAEQRSDDGPHRKDEQ